MGESHWDRAAREALNYNAARDARLAARGAAEAAERDRAGALAAWLTATLDELERVARAAVDGPYDDGRWTVEDSWEEYWDGVTELALPIATVHVSDGDQWRPADPGTAHHVAAHDPRAVLARVEAERAILAEHSNMNDGDCSVCVVGEWGYPVLGGSSAAPWPCDTLRLLAYGHRYDRDGWQDQWTPEGVEVQP